jgi:hypothetical protein
MLALVLVALGLSACGTSLGDLAGSVKNDVEDSSPSLVADTAKTIGITLKKSAASKPAKSTMKAALCTTLQQYSVSGKPPDASQVEQIVEHSAVSANLPSLPEPVELKVRDDALGLLTDAEDLAHDQNNNPFAAAALIEGDVGCLS